MRNDPVEGVIFRYTGRWILEVESAKVAAEIETSTVNLASIDIAACRFEAILEAVTIAIFKGLGAVAHTGHAIEKGGKQEDGTCGPHASSQGG